MVRSAAQGNRDAQAWLDKNTGPTIEEKIEFMQLWAARNKCYLELEGQVGFGRECVGILQGNSYVDTPGSGHNYHPEYEEVQPPETVDSTYHKHDCLCVLGRDEDAIHQLYVWVKKLADNGAVVEIQDRPYTGGVDAMLHGFTSAKAVIPGKEPKVRD